MLSLRNLGSRLKVGTRVTVGFASILVLLGIVAGVSYLGFKTSERNTRVFTTVADSFERVWMVESNFAHMSRNVVTYAQTGSADALKQFRELQQKVTDDIAEAKKLIVTDERRKMLGEAEETFQRYVAGFDEVVKAKAEQAKIDSTNRPMGARMQQLLSEIIQSSVSSDDVYAAAYAGMAQEALMAARLNINVYFLNPLPNIAKAARESIDKVPTLLVNVDGAATGDQNRARTKELMALSEQYVPGIAATISITNTRNSVIENMATVIATKLTDQMKALSSAEMKALDEIGDQTLNTINWAVMVSAAVAAVALAIGLACAFFIGRGIAKPLGRMSGVLKQLADGDKTIEIPFTDRGDEIGDNARAAQAFKENLLRVEAMEAEQKANEARSEAERQAVLQKMAHEFETAVGGIVQAAVAGDFSQRVDLAGKSGMVLNVGTAINSLCENVAKALEDLTQMLVALADGDMTRRITAHYEGNFAELKNNANATAERIGATIGEIKAAAREVTNASAEISTSTTDLSQRTEEQAASLEETTASMEQISSTVKKNAENAQAASNSAASTQQVANHGGKVVAQAVDAMAKIEDSSRKISDIIGVIDEIARQTNLLALNAAVEAARAGEAGRGFAVVASEVRSLAQRSSQAAKDIKDLITNSNSEVKGGVDLVNKAGTALTEIVASINSVVGIVSDIATASAEQSTGIEQVNKALTQMDEATQQNSALVEENAATAKTLEHQAKAMDERVAFFKLAAGSDVVAAVRAPQQAPSRGKPPVAMKQSPAAQRPKATAGGPVGRMHTALATAMKQDPDWKEF